MKVINDHLPAAKQDILFNQAVHDRRNGLVIDIPQVITRILNRRLRLAVTNSPLMSYIS